MKTIPIDYSDDKPIDVLWPEDILSEKPEISSLNDMDLAGLYREISKIRLEVVKASKKRAPESSVQPLSEEKGIRFLTTAINELRRLQPEIQNIAEGIESKVREDFIIQLFPVIDSFDRFFASRRDVNDPKLDQWMEGIRGIYSNILMMLRNHDVKEIPAHGTFNPKFQSALGTEVRNDLPPNTIIRVERRGFIIGKKILRTPEVIVSKRTDLVVD